MKINEIEKVQEKLTYLNYLKQFKEAASYATPLDFRACVDGNSGNKFEFRGEEVEELVKAHVAREMSRTAIELEQYGINVEI